MNTENIPTEDDLMEVLEQIQQVDQYKETVNDQQTRNVCNSKSLLAAVKKAANCTDEHGNITITDTFILGSDNRTTIKVNFESEFDGYAVEGKLLIKTLSNLPEQPVTLTYGDMKFINNRSRSIEVKKGMEILSDNGKFKLPTFEAFEEKERETEQTILEISFFEKEIIPILKELKKFVAKIDGWQTEPNNNVLIKSDGKGLIEFVGSSKRFFKTISQQTKIDKEFSVLVPPYLIDILEKLVSKELDKELLFSFSKESVLILGFDFSVHTNLEQYNSKYPAYETLTGFDIDRSFKVNRTDLLKTLARVGIYADRKAKEVDFKVSNDRLEISTYNDWELKTPIIEIESIENEEGKMVEVEVTKGFTTDTIFSGASMERLPIYNSNIEDLQTKFDITILELILKNYNSEEVTFMFTSEHKIVTIVGTDKDQKAYLVPNS